MTKWAVTNEIEYAPKGDNVGLFSQKVRDEFILIYNLLNRLRTLDASNGTPADTEPYQLHIDTATNKLQLRNGANSSWIELGKIDENYFGLTPENISAVKNTGTVGAIYSGNDSAKPTSAKSYDLYFAFDSKKLYYWTGTTWQLFLSLNFENLLNYADYCVLKSEVGYNGNNKILRLDPTTGLANISISGSSPQVDGKKFLVAGANNGDLISYDASANAFVNKPKSSALSDYVLQTGLEPYAKKTDVAESLSGYTNTINLNSRLENYVLTTNLIDSLTSYAKNSAVDSKVANLNSAVSASLASYEKTSAVNTKIASLNSAVAVSLSAYTPSEDLNNQLLNYALNSDLENALMGYETVEDFNRTLLNYVTKSKLESSLENYSTTEEINSSLESYVSEEEIAVTLQNYSTTEEINSNLESAISDIETSLQSYAVESDVAVSLSNYVTNTDFETTLRNYSLTTDIASSLSGFVSSATLNAYAKKVDVASSLTLYAKTTDLQTATVAGATKANKLSQPFTLNVTGGAIGSAMIDGSNDVILNLTVSNATNANSANSAISALSASNANSATKAQQDGAGNNIQSTYATKTELNNLAARVPSFSFAMSNGVLTITDGANSYQFVGTAV